VVICWASRRQPVKCRTCGRVEVVNLADSNVSCGNVGVGFRRHPRPMSSRGVRPWGGAGGVSSSRGIPCELRGRLGTGPRPPPTPTRSPCTGLLRSIATSPAVHAAPDVRQPVRPPFGADRRSLLRDLPRRIGPPPPGGSSGAGARCEVTPRLSSRGPRIDRFVRWARRGSRPTVYGLMSRNDHLGVDAVGGAGTGVAATPADPATALPRIGRPLGHRDLPGQRPALHR
jgi:hypothetical protein